MKWDVGRAFKWRPEEGCVGVSVGVGMDGGGTR